MSEKSTLDESERRFILFHAMPPPVERWLLVPPDRDEAGNARIVAVKLSAGKRITADVCISSYRRVAQFLLEDLTVDIVALTHFESEVLEAIETEVLDAIGE